MNRIWCPPRESNTAPTDYESAALTKHELGGLYPAIPSLYPQPEKHSRDDIARECVLLKIRKQRCQRPVISQSWIIQHLIVDHPDQSLDPLRQKSTYRSQESTQAVETYGDILPKGVELTTQMLLGKNEKLKSVRQTKFAVN